MKQNKIIVFIIMILAFVFQALSFGNSPRSYYENGFAVGINNIYTNFDIAINLIPVVLPVIFILFFISGSVYDLTHGYGKLLIIRSYSKSKLVLKLCLKNFTTVLFIALLQLLIFLFVNNRLQPTETGMTESVIMYFIILHSLVMLQCLLELFMRAQIANIAIFIYSFASYYIAQTVTKNVCVKIILFPCLMYGMQNGAADGENIYFIYLISGMILNIAFMMMCIRKFKRSDIF